MFPQERLLACYVKVCFALRFAQVVRFNRYRVQPKCKWEVRFLMLFVVCRFRGNTARYVTNGVPFRARCAMIPKVAPKLQMPA